MTPPIHTTTDTPRASFDELLVFANKVRKAGGGNVIDALMPGYPGCSHSCLIARNLNFNCSVHKALANSTWIWVMWVDDIVLADKIASELDLVKQSDHEIRLPPEIGRIASNFDSWNNLLVFHHDHCVLDGDLELFNALTPYIHPDHISAMTPIYSESGERLL